MSDKPHYQPLTTEQKLQNCILALANWNDVSPRSVRLDSWRCGTHACFGGHLARWPEFKAMGVKADIADGAPQIDTQDCLLDGSEVAEHLFGSSTMFFAAGFSRDDDLEDLREADDHRLVVNRLECQIARLTEQLPIEERACPA